MKRIAVVSLALVVLAGCGGPSGVAFGEAGLPLAQKLQAAAKEKKADQIDGVLRRAKQLSDNKNVRSDEYATIVKICDLMKAGQWEKAQQLADACVEMSQRGKSK